MPPHTVKTVFLTDLCLVDSSLLINWTSPFVSEGESGLVYYCYYY